MAMLANKNIMKKIEDNVRPILKDRQTPSPQQVEKIKAEFTERLAKDPEFARYVQQISFVNVETQNQSQNYVENSNTPNEASFVKSVEFKQAQKKMSEGDEESEYESAEKDSFAQPNSKIADRPQPQDSASSSRNVF